MTKLVQAKEKENTELQQFWLRAQTDLVNMAKKGGEMTESIQDLRMRLTVLSHKKVVVNGKTRKKRHS
jgi:coiled-coil domain-containing protein 40